jgi:hypothetical protein
VIRSSCCSNTFLSVAVKMTGFLVSVVSAAGFNFGLCFGAEAVLGSVCPPLVVVEPLLLRFVFIHLFCFSSAWADPGRRRTRLGTTVPKSILSVGYHILKSVLRAGFASPQEFLFGAANRTCGRR